MNAAVLGASLRAASISVGKSVAIVVVGWIVCKYRMKGGRQTVRDVTQTLVYVYSPCLSITNLISTLTGEKLLELWLLPVYSYILAAMGMVVGVVISAIFDPAGTYRPVVIASTAVRHIQLNPLHNSQGCPSREMDRGRERGRERERERERGLP